MAPGFRAHASSFHSKATNSGQTKNFLRSGLLGAGTFNAASKGKTVLGTLVFQNFRRGLTTDGGVITQRSQADAWKRLGITVVSAWC